MGYWRTPPTISQNVKDSNAMCKSNIHNCFRCGKEVNRVLGKKRNGEKADRIFCSRPCYDEQRKDDWRAKGFNCKTCGKRVEKPQQAGARKFCSMQCRKNLNIKACVTECKVCKTVFSAIKWRYENGEAKYYTKDKTRKTCSTGCHHMFYRIDEERKRKIGESEKGSKHHNWQGGGKRRGYRGANWLEIAEKARKRAGYKCEHCGITQDECGRKLDVNHIEPFHQSKNKSHANRLSNLEALCKSCHMLTEWKWRKENQLQYAMKF